MIGLRLGAFCARFTVTTLIAMLTLNGCSFIRWGPVLWG